MKGAEEALNCFYVPYELSIVAAHRTPKMTIDFATGVESKGIEVIIAVCDDSFIRIAGRACYKFYHMFSLLRSVGIYSNRTIVANPLMRSVYCAPQCILKLLAFGKSLCYHQVHKFKYTN